MYDILSISIHELNENQSKEYYEDLKAILDMQFEYMKTEEDKENQSKKLDSTISRILNEIKK